MDLKLSGKTALVTGSTRGIGEAIARALADEGVSVVIHGRNQQRARDVAESIEENGGKARPACGDLSTDESAEKVFRSAVDAFGGIGILVNNAGSFEACGWTDATPERWAETYNSNVLSMVRLNRLALPVMQQAEWGRIVHVASISAVIAPPVFPDYAAAKAATLNLTVSLMQEAAHTGVTVNTVSPGPVVTDTWEAFAMQLARFQGWEADLKRVKQRLLAGPMANPSSRLGVPEDVAAVCTFLASPLADYINGANIPVSGGLAARVSG